MMRTSTARKMESGETPAPTLQDLYRKVWGNVAYRKYAPGERNIDAMLEVLEPRRGASFIDFGCGTGRPAFELAKRGYSVLAVDFADNSLDNAIDVPFLVADLTALPELSAQYGYCTDVMEHIEPDRVDAVLAGIARCVRNSVFFSISTVKDAFGPALAGKQLHLTIRDAAWWRETLAKHWPHVEIISESSIECFVVGRKLPRGFVENTEGVVNTACNTPDKDILENVRANAARADIAVLETCIPHDRHAIIVGGGPSLRHYLREIKLRQDDPNSKQDIFALNGAAHFLLAHGITPDYLLMIDPRERNVEFVQDHPARAYLLASQVSPKVFDTVMGCDVTMFHQHMEGIESVLPNWKTLVCGAVSAGLTAMSVVTTAGYRMVHLYGYDSCDAEGDAHAYAQMQTDAEQKRLVAQYNGKAYSCSYAMFAQAELFPEVARMLTEFGVTITVHGNGLLPDIARDLTGE